MRKLIWGIIVTLVMTGTIVRVFLWIIDVTIGLSVFDSEGLHSIISVTDMAFVIFCINLILTIAGNWVLHGRITLYKMLDDEEGVNRYTFLRGWHSAPEYIYLDEEGENARERRRKYLFWGFIGSGLFILALIRIYREIFRD